MSDNQHDENQTTIPWFYPTFCGNCLDPIDCPILGCVRELFGGIARPIIRTTEDEVD